MSRYIGARYVIKVYENSLDPSSAEWESNVNYEPLILVTYNNGSYLSKKDVPANIGDPASNPTYWAQTGFYNGQIAFLQSQIDEIKDAFVTPEMFGAVGDGVADDTAALASAFACPFVIMADATYRITDKVEVTSNIIIGHNSNINADFPSWVERVLDVKSLNTINISGVNINANNKASYGFFIGNDGDLLPDLDNVIVTGCSCKNTNNKTSGNNSSGIFIYRNNYHALVSECTVTNCARESSTPGIKASIGIHVSHIVGSCEINNNKIDNITYEVGEAADADGIHAYSLNANDNSQKEDCSILISNNSIKDCQGRFIKTQGENIKVTGNTMHNDNIEIIDNFVGIDMQTAGGIVSENWMKIDGYTGGSGAHFITVAGKDYTKQIMSAAIANNTLFASTSIYSGMLIYGAKIVDSFITITGNNLKGATTMLYIGGDDSQTSKTEVAAANNIYDDYTNSIYVKPSIASLIKVLRLNNLGANEKNAQIYDFVAPNTITTPKDLLDYIEYSIDDLGFTTGFVSWTGVGTFAYSVNRRNATYCDVILYYQSANIYRLWHTPTNYYFQFTGSVI